MLDLWCRCQEPWASSRWTEASFHNCVLTSSRDALRLIKTSHQPTLGKIKDTCFWSSQPPRQNSIHCQNLSHSVLITCINSWRAAWSDYLIFTLVIQALNWKLVQPGRLKSRCMSHTTQKIWVSSSPGSPFFSYRLKSVNQTTVTKLHESRVKQQPVLSETTSANFAGNLIFLP